MKKFFRPERAEWLALAASILFVALFNLPFWQRMLAIVGPLDGHGVKMLGLAFVLLTAFINLLLLLLLWPRIGRPLLTVLFVLTAAISYFMSQYGVLIDMNMVRNAMQTDGAEVRDLITVKMVLTVLLLGGLPSLWLWKAPLRFRPVLRELGCRLLALLVSSGVLLGVAMVGYQDFASLFRNNRELRFVITPTNYLQATSSYLQSRYEKAQPLQQVGLDARRGKGWPQGSKPRVLVLVVGETARADHFSLNGYARQTNPELSQASGLINYPDAWSCGTETAVSVPCMFSSLPREQFDTDEARHRENLLDVLKRSGLDVAWLDNNSGCKEVCNRVSTELLYDDQDPKYCNSEECFDDILLGALDSRLKHLRHDAVIVLHQKGSHGPAYYKRYPPQYAAFQPECRTSELQKCGRQEIVNAFDNTIRYTDHILAQIIARLQADKRVAGSLFYLSDHGESLGENNMYLHATPYIVAPDAQKHIPMLAWFSPQWLAADGMTPGCLQQGSRQRYSQDNLFHTVLGLMDVQTSLYEKGRDMYAACRTQ
ncbi:phosphoethanolamine transferase [Vogesella sp. LIG4]|uniref:phosphoethanolamine transferase n=1 Tax=Vogesella sp. LIG4 TaxID=1192162 RepID=UPI00081FAFD6|nr:phosphoethanolamine--lipid A transferase [Vogesella sp. LIG4]SCK15765.1 lipid A ethanolaminephosphotransferase [Vogesella sp. LIG4]